MKTLAIRVLGDFGVDGVEPQSLGSRKARQALHLLALAEGHRVPADVLIDALWADAPPARPEDQVAVLMSRLRSVLGRDRIEYRDGGYLLRYDWLDAVELAALVAEIERRQADGNPMGAAAAARVALGLLRDPGAVPVAGEWAQLRRADLDRATGRARQIAASVLLEAGDWMAATDAAGAALDRDPYDETSLRTLMRGYVVGGQAAAALAAYAAARERLADDLGTDPSPETASLYTAILRGELVVPGPLPVVRRSDLVGRDDELACMDSIALRSRAGTQVAVVDGEAGIGKTTLLRGWAISREAAGDAVLMVRCGQLDRSMPLDALLRALAGLLRRLGSDVSADMLDADAAVVAPLLGLSSRPRQVPLLSEGLLGPAVLYAALVRTLARLTNLKPLVILVDDAHLAGSALSDLLRFLLREDPPVAVVAAVRAGEDVSLPATAVIHLDVLDRDAATQLVGKDRVDEIYERSKGHPLFLTELAQQAAGAELPASLVESVSARCDELGTAATLLRTAAVIGQDLDVDLLAAVLGRPVVELLDEAEQAVAAQFLAESEGRFRFRHELVMQALAASASVGRAALLHRQVGRVLAARPSADPGLVAYHARLGGDLELAASSLCEAASRAAERFDHASAEALLDDAISLHPSPEAWLARARVRTRRRRYAEALADVEQAKGAGAAALEVGAWACYFDRRFALAAQYAEDGALAAEDAATRARCLSAGGRTKHAAGDLGHAEILLGEALSLAAGPDRVSAAAWLGVLRSHQSRMDEALSLLRPAARGQVGVDHTSATLHALLFSGHSHALAGRPAAALGAFSRHTAEVDRRQVPRFAGRAVNFAGWVLRNIGASGEALDHHLEALETAEHEGTTEVTIAALEDLAEQSMQEDEFEAAGELLDQARDLLVGDLVFGWRLALKHQLISARLALATGDPERADDLAAALEATALVLGVPRYVTVGRVLRHRAGHALGRPADHDAVAQDLDAMDAAVAIESWWMTGELAAEFGVPAWLDQAADRAERLAANAGDYADGLRAAAAKRLDAWRAAIG